MNDVRESQGFYAQTIYSEEAFDICRITLWEDFPGFSKWKINHESDSVITLYGGSVFLEIEGEGKKLLSSNACQAAAIPKGKKYRLSLPVGVGCVMIDFICHPSWKPEQHETFE